jgi:phospholipid-binding lipoprotein MlaA
MIRIFLSLLVLLLSGCASLTTADSEDPLETLNRKTYAFNETFDRYLLKPVAKGYDTALPKPIKIMVSNFFSNLDDVGVTLNDLLQLKFKQAASDGSRVLFNSTFGLLGLLNVTDRLEKHHEDFGQTLGYWGVPNGPYIVLPFFGPSSARDSVGLLGDSLSSVYPRIPDVATRNQLYVTDKVQFRAGLFEFDATLETASDPYAFMREFYLGQRLNRVYDGNPPRTSFVDEEDAPAGN